jgi:multiple sugar transport system substrate-binding protein
MRRTRSRFIAAAVGGALALTIGLTGCSDDRTALTVMFYGDNYGVENWQAVADAFMETHEDVRIELIHKPAEYETSLQTMIAAGEAPDVFIIGEAALGQLIDSGVLLDLNPVLAEQSLDTGAFIDQAMWEEDGALYGIASNVNAEVLYYNTAMFDEAGLEHPPTDPAEAWTWEEFADASRALTEHFGEGHWGSSIPTHPGPWEPLIASNGGRWFNEERTEFLLNEPESVEVFEAIKALQDEGVSTPADAGIDTDVLLQSNQVAMHINGTFFMPNVLDAWGEDAGMAILPSFGTPQTMTFIDPVVAYAETEHPDLAAEFIYFHAQAENNPGAYDAIPSSASAQEGEGRQEWLDATERPEGFDETITSSLQIAMEDSPWRTRNLAEIWTVMTWTEGLSPYFNGEVEDLHAELTRLKPAVEDILNR